MGGVCMYMAGVCLSTRATHKHVQVSTAAAPSTQQCSREHHWLIWCQQPAASELSCEQVAGEQP